MKKRTFLTLLTLLCASTPYMLSAKEKTTRKPNIIFILADDLGYGDISANGQKHFKTPNIDKIVQEGMNFTQFYTPFPVCAPARCAIMTGKHAGHCTIRDNGEMPGEGQFPLRQGESTIPLMLKENGYVTACIGKWGMGSVNSSGDPLNQGFDLFFGYNCQRLAHFYYPEHLWRNQQKIMLPGNIPNRGGPHYAPDLLEKEALEFIKKNKDTPFFLWYTTPIPHASLQVPDSMLNLYKGKFKETPYKGGGYAAQPYPRAAAAAMVTQLDNEVGKMMTLVKSLGLDQETLFIFASDNGPSPEGGKDLDFFQSAAGMKKGKGSLFEGGVRVPFMIRWPGKIAPGTVCENAFTFYDLMSTFGEAAAISNIPANDGISFLPTLTGQLAKQKLHDILYWEFGGYGGQTAVRIGDWKGVATGLRQSGNLKLELYNLTNDRKEKNNVAAKHPEIIQRMMQTIRESHTPSADTIFRIPALENFTNTKDLQNIRNIK